MTVVKFERRRAPAGEGWQTAELQQFIAVSANAIAVGEASSWEVGRTESGDPQVFLIGPPPDYDCILSISRLGETYVIEDGAGRILFEQHSPARLAEQAAAALRRRKTALVSRVRGCPVSGGRAAPAASPPGPASPRSATCCPGHGCP
jgi:hypothetical protein